MRDRTNNNGFSLIELTIVLVIIGAMFLFTVPAIKGFMQSNDLMTAKSNIAQQLVLAHEKAMATGGTQQLRFMANYNSSSDYHIWSNNVASPSWRLPTNISYYWGTGTQNSFRMTSDGRCMDSGFIIIQDARGHRDTVSVLQSGLVIQY